LDGTDVLYYGPFLWDGKEVYNEAVSKKRDYLVMGNLKGPMGVQQSVEDFWLAKKK